MATCECVFRPESLKLELSTGFRYKALNIQGEQILITNNLNNVQWYPLKYFKFV